MYKELMTPTELSIKDKKKIIKGNVLRAAIYARSKVVEALTEENERYYLVYYKNSLIYGEKLDQVKEDTFIHKAFHEGIMIESPHPILTAFISHSSISIPIKNKLFSQLQHQYTLQETAYIMTTLDAFIEKNKLIEMIDKIYYHYRRSGNFKKSFQIMQILSAFAPELKSAKERLNSREYSTYLDFYHSTSLPSILEKDPLYVELHCFTNRINVEKRFLLETILSKRECFVEVLMLWLENVKILQLTESIEKYTDIALKFVTIQEWILILGEANINPFHVLPETKSIFEKMIEKGNYEQAALYLVNFLDDLPSSYDLILSQIWENSDSKFIAAHLNEFILVLKQLIQRGKSQHLEQKISQLAGTLLEENDLKKVHEKLSTIQVLIPESKVIRKISTMSNLLEDPDRMMELGDYYAEFKQFDKAIDCFFWEMELQPQNPSPVQKICKMYQHKGMAKEAAAYQKVYEQLKSNQEMGA